MHDDFLWVEKYRPKNIDQCILPQNVKETFASFVEQGRYLIFSSLAQQVLVKLLLRKHFVTNLEQIFMSSMDQTRGDSSIPLETKHKTLLRLYLLQMEQSTKSLSSMRQTTLPQMYNFYFGHR